MKNDKKLNKEKREIMVSHKSDLLTQDLVLKGVFQYCKFKDFGASFDFPYIRYEHSTGNISYPVNQIEELGQINFTQQDFERLNKYLKGEILDYKKYIKKFEKEVTSADNKQKKIVEYFDKSLRVVSMVPYFAFEVGLHKLLEKEKISFNEIPSTSTYASRSAVELTKITKQYKQELSKDRGTKKISKVLREDLEGFCGEFGYLGMKYFGGNPWTVEQAYEMLFTFIDQPVEIENKTVIKKHSSPYIKIASDLLYLRTQNWELVCYGCYLFRKFIMEHFSNELEYEKILNLRIDDLLTIVRGGDIAEEKYQIREEFILEIRPGGVFLGNEKDKKIEEVEYKGEDLIGTSAQLGKVRGTVKVVLTPSECNKVEMGDILVATMSTPDFLPAMYKAIAFITDIGGITCHAAIVAREMNKPCIIGTKIATKVLKDGMEVEVDADNGVVKIIKKVK